MDYIIEIHIDGVEQVGVPVEVIFQRTPRPGGHKYCLRTTFPVLFHCVRGVGIGRHIGLTEEQQRRVFRGLGAQLGGVGKRESIKYILNSAEEVLFDGTELVICGECSPVIRKTKSPEI